MSERLVAIYVETPYQLITSLNIAINYLHADGCILFLMEQYYLTERKFQISSKHPFIRGIFYIQDYEEVGAFKHHLLRLKGIIKGYPSKDFPNMCCYYKTRPKRMPNFSALICNKYEVKLADQYLTILRRNADVYVIEDGTVDYVGPIYKVKSDYHRIYYWPELFRENFNKIAIKAPTISMKDIKLRKLIEDVFRIDESEKAKIQACRCIFFHQPSDVIGEDPKFSERQNAESKIINLLYSKFGDGFFVKLHPRDELNIFPKYKKIISDIPWEALMWNIKDISNLLIVGLDSTALITPKNTFDLEPYVVTTTSLFQYWKDDIPTESVDRTIRMFEYLSSNYRDSEKVIIPKSMDELIESLDKM